MTPGSGAPRSPRPDRLTAPWIMGIHDQSYRRYAGPRAEPGSAWSVIAWSGIRALLAKRLFLLVLLFAWSQFVVRAVLLYLSANFPSMELIAPSAQTFRDFFDQQGFFVFVVTVYAGAGLIANDRRANALQIYLAKPLTRAEYVAGKAGVLVVFLLLVTWAPAMLLLVLQGDVRRQPRVRAREPVPSAGDDGVRAARGAGGVVRNARPVVALDQRPLRRNALRGRHPVLDGDLPDGPAASRGRAPRPGSR